MSTNPRTSRFARLTALASLASMGVLLSIPAGAQIGTNRVVASEKAVSNAPSQQQPTKASYGIEIAAKVGVRSIADELEIANNAFSILNAAVKSAGLTSALAGRGPFTIFAPTDEAFRKLPRGTVQTLLRPENKAKLTQILTYHVVSGDISSFDLKPGSVLRLQTLAGKPLIVRVSRASEITVNGAQVVLADIPARNGMIHGISSVLLP